MTELEEASFTYFEVNQKKKQFGLPINRRLYPKKGENVGFPKVEEKMAPSTDRHHLHSYGGTSRHHLHSYLVEYIWRTAVKAEGQFHFNAILEKISLFLKRISKLQFSQFC